VLASGGVYEPGTPMEAMNFAEPYLRAIFAFIGITDVTFVRAGGTSRARDEAGREPLLQPVRALIRDQVQAA
jgi:FMN-dependent NADH-azoreductase